MAALPEPFEEYFGREVPPGQSLQVNIPHGHLIRLYEMGVEIGNRIGVGGFGSVHTGQFGPDALVLRGVRFAVKVQIQARGISPMNEARVMTHLNHRHCVRIYHVLHFDTSPRAAEELQRYVDAGVQPPNENRVYIFMELADYGSIRSVLAQFPNCLVDMDTLNAWLGQLASALDYLHAQNMVHQDLHEGNVLFFRNLATDTIDAKLSDFGCVHWTRGRAPTQEAIFDDIQDLSNVYRNLAYNSVEGEAIRRRQHLISDIISQMELAPSLVARGQPCITLEEIANQFGYEN